MTQFLEMLRGGGVRRYGENTVWLLAEKVLRLPLMLLVGIYVANQIGSAQLGSFDYALTLITFFAVLIDFGMDGVIVREIVNHPQKQGEILGSALVIRLFGALAMGLLVLAIMIACDFSHFSIVMAILAVSFSLHVAWGLESLFKARVQAKYLGISQIVSMLCFAIVRVVVVTYSDNLWYLAGCELINQGVLLGGFYWFYRKKIKHQPWRASRQEVWLLLRESWPLALSALATLACMRVDKVFVTNILGNEANGVYSMGVRFAESVYFFPMAVCASLFPAIINARKNDIKNYNFRLRMLFSGLSYAGIFMSLGMALVAPLVITWLLNFEYHESIVIVQVLAINLPLVFFGMARDYWLLAEGLQRYNLFFIGCGLTVNVVLNSILIPKFGISGAATYNSFSCTTLH